MKNLSQAAQRQFYTQHLRSVTAPVGPVWLLQAVVLIHIQISRW